MADLGGGPELYIGGAISYGPLFSNSYGGIFRWNGLRWQEVVVMGDGSAGLGLYTMAQFDDGLVSRSAISRSGMVKLGGTPATGSRKTEIRGSGPGLQGTP